MIHYKTILQTLVLLVSFSLFSCTDLDSYSNINKIKGFEIKTHAPASIIIGKAVLDAENDNIEIPVLYGRYLFPMKFTAELEIPSEVKKIVGLDFSSELQFQHIDSELQFFVVAANGATRRYTIRLKEIPLEENNSLFKDVSFTETVPASTILSTALHTSDDGNQASLYGVNLTYPITTTPTFSIVSNAHFGKLWVGNDSIKAIPFKNGESVLAFKDESTVYSLSVIAENGLEKTWKIALINCVAADGIVPSPEDGLYIDPKAFSARAIDAGKLFVEDYVLDNDGRTIVVNINSKDNQTLKSNSATKAAPINSPLKISMSMPVKQWVDLVDMKQDTTMVFSGYDDIKTFYIIDPLTKTSKKWSVILSENKSTKSDVVSFTSDYGVGLIRTTGTASDTPSIIMDANKKVTIYPNDKTIVLTYDSYANDNRPAAPNYWRLTLTNILVTVSKGATFTLPAIEWKATSSNQAAKLLTQAREFPVTAENGSVSLWKIVLAPKNQVLSSECDLMGMVIDKTAPTFVQLESNIVNIDHINKKVIINLKDDNGAYPLAIYPSYTLSEYASVITQNNAMEPLIFDRAETVQEIIVKAQDGTTKNYKAVLLSPIKAEGADIEKIEFGNISPAGFSTLNAPSIDKNKATITLHLESEDVAFPINVAYESMTLTDKASVAIPPQGAFKFNKPTDRVPIIVTAENGKTKMWQIVLDYRPQLKGWRLDNWSKVGLTNVLLPVDYWATANSNISGNGTKPIEGSSGNTSDQGAQLVTDVKLNIIAAASLFVGWFDVANIIAGLNDPVSITYFGLPFNPTAKIKGIQFDVWYSPTQVDQDWGSAVVQLINWDGKAKYVFHGDKPKDTGAANISNGALPHPDNTAVIAAEGSLKFGTGAQKNQYGHTIRVVENETWVKNVFVPVDGSVKFTHLNVVFSSSAYGDYFVGQKGSQMRLDNIRIVYE